MGPKSSRTFGISPYLYFAPGALEHSALFYTATSRRELSNTRDLSRSLHLAQSSRTFGNFLDRYFSPGAL